MKEYAYRNLHLDGDEFENTYWATARFLEKKLGKDNSTIHNILIRMEYILEQFHIPYDPHALAITDLYWNTMFEHMKPEPFLIETLEALKQKGFKLGVGTNMTAEIQFKKLQLLHILSYMDMVVTSEEALSEKPNKRFFQLCLEKAERMAGASANECVFIGDSFENDVMGAVQSGMIPVWYNPKRQGKPSAPYEASELIPETDYTEITSFRDVAKLACSL